MKRVMAVYDIDPFYADRFADFANQKEKVPFTVVPFTTMERLKAYLEDHTVELLLVSQFVEKRDLEKLPIKQIITLTEGEVAKLENTYPNVYKYQSTDGVIREVMSLYCGQTQEELQVVTGIKAGILGVYSPVNRCLKTSFALTAGQVLGQDARVLYLTFEEYSGFSKMVGETFQSDLSDLLYYYHQGKFNLPRLNAVVHSLGNLDYVPPARYPEDLYQVTAQELADFIGRLAKETNYDTVLVDLGQMGRRSVEILEVCDIIYMPVKDDCVSVAKLEEFEEYLQLSNRQPLLEKIQKLKLPYHNSFGRKDTYLDQLLWGELGDYVRQLLKGPRPWLTH
ncbi:MAG: hypothetical protein ACLTKI_05480 [Lachnospiraceae bacterium]